MSWWTKPSRTGAVDKDDSPLRVCVRACLHLSINSLTILSLSPSPTYTAPTLLPSGLPGY